MIKRMILLVVLAVVMSANITIQGQSAESNYTTKDGKIYENSREIVLNGIAWFGSESWDRLTPSGLWKRGYKEIIAQVKTMGFNAIRYPFCPTTLRNQPIGWVIPEKNPELSGKKSLEAMDIILKEINSQGLYILMDHHRPDCREISELWYTPEYSEAQWISDLNMVANRYKGLNKFLGIEIKNEPHGAATWSNSRPLTDYNKAAERAGKELLARNKNLLVFVSGVGDNPECDTPINKWWGGNLSPHKCYPIDTNMIPKEKLIFTPHVYGPDVYDQPYFKPTIDPTVLRPIWENHFGFMTSSNTIVPSEFGGRYRDINNDKAWQIAIIDYFIEKRICNTFFWSLNPESGDTGGILKDDWLSINEDKLANLKRLYKSCELTPSNVEVVVSPVLTPTPTPVPVPTPTPIDNIKLSFVLKSRTTRALCGEFKINNNSSTAVNNWNIALNANLTQITSSSTGVFAKVGNNSWSITPRNSQSKIIPARTILTVPFCANTTVANPIVSYKFNY
jgi:endoglucanase